MKFGLEDLRTERQSRAAIGMDKERFIKLLLGFKSSYFETYGTSLKERQMDNGIEYCINSEEELLLYTLFVTTQPLKKAKKSSIVWTWKNALI